MTLTNAAIAEMTHDDLRKLIDQAYSMSDREPNLPRQISDFFEAVKPSVIVDLCRRVIQAETDLEIRENEEDEVIEVEVIPEALPVWVHPRNEP